MDLLLGRKPANASAKPGAAAPANSSVAPGVQPGLIGGGAVQSMAPTGGPAPAVIDVDVTTFERDVVGLSAQVPVIVDFWAPWCAPCKQLGPLLEKAVAATGGRVRMAKINIDQNPEIAQALRVQSIPTVYAFYQGRPVDGFMGAVPESQVKAFVDKLLKLAGGELGDPVEALLAEAKEAQAQGQPQMAAEIYAEILDADPNEARARAGLARLLLEAGDFANARTVLAEAPPESAKHAEITAARTAVELAEQGSQSGESAGLARKLQAAPDDHQLRFDLAMAYYAEGNREGAVDALLEIVRRDRTWNEEGARKQLVKFFEAFGFADPLSVSGRKRLSTLLFS